MQLHVRLRLLETVLSYYLDNDDSALHKGRPKGCQPHTIRDCP